MCGACGHSAEIDAWTGTFGSRHARWEVVHLLNAALARAHHPGRVQFTNGFWVVRAPTGAAGVAGTITDVVNLLADIAPISRQLKYELRQAPQTPTAVALAAAVAALSGTAARMGDI